MRLKKLYWALVALLALMSNLTLAGESGPDNGTDYVKVLFANARVTLTHELNPIHPTDVPQLGLDAQYSQWLLGRGSSGSPRLEELKLYLQKLALEFQKAPCEDSEHRQSSICFLYGPAHEPIVLVSLDQNRLTTAEQAMAMLVHEAGHFTGEKNHLFLDGLGTELVHALEQPKMISDTEESTETVANPFSAKDECEKGTSSQAQVLRGLAHQKIESECARRRISCDASRIEYVFRGESEFKPGLGYTMRVKCTVSATLNL